MSFCYQGVLSRTALQEPHHDIPSMNHLVYIDFNARDYDVNADPLCVVWVLLHMMILIFYSATLLLLGGLPVWCIPCYRCSLLLKTEILPKTIRFKLKIFCSDIFQICIIFCEKCKYQKLLVLSFGADLHIKLKGVMIFNHDAYVSVYMACLELL